MVEKLATSGYSPKLNTVNSLITHTPRWTTQAMGYGIWGSMGYLGVTLGSVAAQDYGVWGMGEYGL